MLIADNHITENPLIVQLFYINFFLIIINFYSANGYFV